MNRKHKITFQPIVFHRAQSLSPDPKRKDRGLPHTV
jgi:hypothetical protein